MEAPFRLVIVRLPAPLLRWLAGVVFLIGSLAGSAQNIDLPQIKAQAEAGNAKAQNALGAMFNLGQGVPEDHAEALKWFRKAADQGETEAFYNLGTMSLHGRGVTSDAGEAVKWILRSAEKGFAVAQFGLGALYQHGTGVEKDPTEAANWYFRAAEQGYAAAQHALGMMYFQAQGVPQDYISAYTLFSLAARQGMETAADAKKLVTELLADDQIKEGIRRVAAFKPKQPAAVVLPKVREVKAEAASAETKPASPAPPTQPDPRLADLKARAAKNDAEAQFDLGSAYQAGRDVPQDFAQAVKWFSQAAQQGHGKAQRYLGSMFFQGRGVEQDYVSAYKWLDLAATQKMTGAAEARDLVAGLMSPEQIAAGKKLATEFRTGRPVEVMVALPAVPIPLAVPETKTPAAVGDVAELLKRARQYATGQGVPQDLGEAEKLFRRAAEQGNAEAQSTLGIMYFHGRGVRQDKAEAIKWLGLAAAQNRAPAQFWLGQANEKLGDVERAGWYRKSAEQGYGPAQYYLATFYAAGQGVPQDYIEAYKWFTLSAGQGNTQAATVRDATAQFMTPEQIAEGKRRADGFVPRVAAPSGNK